MTDATRMTVDQSMCAKFKFITWLPMLVSVYQI